MKIHINFISPVGTLELHREAGERLTAEQKYHIIMLLIGCVAGCVALWMFFWATTR